MRCLLTILLMIPSIILAQDTLTIRQIQEVPSGGDFSPYIGSDVITGGVVTTGNDVFYAGSNYIFFMSDPGGGEFSGIKVFSSSNIGMPHLSPGDSVLCQGVVNDFGMTLLDISLGSIEVRNQVQLVPPIVIHSIDIAPLPNPDAEKYEACLVQISDLIADSSRSQNQATTWFCHDNLGNFIAKRTSNQINASLTPSDGIRFPLLRGVVEQLDNSFSIKPRYVSDLATELFCNYILGDINGSGEFNGVDIVYACNYLAFSSNYPAYPCIGLDLSRLMYISGDVNGSGSFNGIDVTYMVAYFKGGNAPVVNSDYPGNNQPPYARIRGNLNSNDNLLLRLTYVVADTLTPDGSFAPWRRNLYDQHGGYLLLAPSIDTPGPIAIHAFCDTDNDDFWQPDSFDLWGFYDANGNGSWDSGDTLVLHPGELIQGINITLNEYLPGRSMMLGK